MTYSRGADAVFSCAPLALQRVFGGLLWLVSLVSVAGFISANHVATTYTHNGSFWAMVLAYFM